MTPFSFRCLGAFLSGVLLFGTSGPVISGAAARQQTSAKAAKQYPRLPHHPTQRRLSSFSLAQIAFTEALRGASQPEVERTPASLTFVPARKRQPAALRGAVYNPAKATDMVAALIPMHLDPNRPEALIPVHLDPFRPAGSPPAIAVPATHPLATHSAVPEAAPMVARSEPPSAPRPQPSAASGAAPPPAPTAIAAAVPPPTSAPAAVANSFALTSPAPAPAANGFALTSTADTQQTMHVTVGHIVFLNTRARVKRIYIANPTVLDSYTVSPNQVVVTAKVPGLSSVVVWDENDVCQTYMVSSDIDVEELRSSLHQAFPSESLEVEGREGKVVLSGSVGTDAASDAAVKLAALYSKDVANSVLVNSARIKQVRLKVRIVEVDRSKLDQFGINLFSPGGGTVGGSGTGQFASAATSNGGTATPSAPATLALSDPLNFFLYNFKNNIGAAIKDLETKQVLQILAEPNITTLSGQKASFLAGGEFPFPVVQGSAGGTATVTVQFRPYGVKVEFTPVVNSDGSIALKIMPEVSALDFTNAVTISGYTIPALSTKRADTQVVLRSGQSFAISGLLDRRTTDAFSHTPGIASVPILGQLFKSKGVNLSTSELMVIVTPTVIDPLNDTDPTAKPDQEPAPVVPFLKLDSFDNSLPAAAKKP